MAQCRDQGLGVPFGEGREVVLAVARRPRADRSSLPHRRPRRVRRWRYRRRYPVQSRRVRGPAERRYAPSPGRCRCPERCQVAIGRLYWFARLVSEGLCSRSADGRTIGRGARTSREIIRRMGAAQAVHEWEPPRAAALARPGVLTGSISPLAGVISQGSFSSRRCEA